jgi:hypothetical protein
MLLDESERQVVSTMQGEERPVLMKYTIVRGETHYFPTRSRPPPLAERWSALYIASAMTGSGEASVRRHKDFTADIADPLRGMGFRAHVINQVFTPRSRKEDQVEELGDIEPLQGRGIIEKSGGPEAFDVPAERSD